MRSNFAVILELSSAVAQEKLFSPRSKAAQQSAGMEEMLLSLIQVYLISPMYTGLEEPVHAFPNSHLPMQLADYLLLLEGTGKH